MPTRTVQQTVTPVPELSFQINVLAAEFDEQFPQPGFDVILDKLGAKEKFAYLKLNHGIWELLVKLENLGIPRAQIMTHDGAELDAMTGFSDVPFFGGGFLGPLLARLRNLPDPSQGLTFVSSLEPWPGSYAIESTPIANRTHTDEIRRYFTDPKHLDNIENGGWTGHELKAAVISQTFGKLIAQMADRPVLLLGNSEFTTALTGWGVHDAQVHNVPIAGARLQCDALRDVVADWLARHQGQSPLVAANAGEATTTFLGLHAFESFDDIAFLDFGGSLAACAPNIAARANWVTTYKHHLRRVSAEWPAAVAQPMQPVFDSAFAERAPQLVQIATDHGVPQPQPAALTAPGLRSEVQFLENKSPDFQRIADFMTLSAQANRYANGGPVAHLLEQVIAVQLALPAHRHVVAVANGSAALALTCGAAAIETGQSDHLTWLSNGFTFFSASIGPLAQTRAIDCTPDGGFDLNQMASLGADEFGGVIHTNAFANHSKWDPIAAACRAQRKPLVIDNAVGLLDRPASALRENAPMEIISAHHTKAWGHGECGLIICNAAQAQIIRKLANFGVGLPAQVAPFAMNGKLSDLSAAAVLERLERMHDWGHRYRLQRRRNISLMVDADAGITPFSAGYTPKSPTSFTPF
ncbi:DegT/DnrJ/EryC1/StrS family aminotransferase [Sulfitobacter sp. HNIBRBA2951]|uniref:DegT/DnrJ/EryC1/StrS family aminotransferase n=1 Tax=Sulfitobacter aquimarinus TaxID=3158557 RepID=UPI0032E031C3